MPPEEKAPETDPALTPTPEPAAPATVDLSGYVSREDYARMEGQLAQMGQMLQTIAGGQQRVVPEPNRGPQYTDDQLAEMLESGEGRKILEANRYLAQQQLAPMAREFVDFRDGTTRTAAAYNRKIAELGGKMPHATDPGVKASMDAFFQRLPANALTDPEAIDLAYRNAVADPANFQRLVDREVEAKLRQRAGADDPIGDVGQRTTPRDRVTSDKAGVPTVRELLGDGAVQTIRDLGYTNVDEWVRKSQRGVYKNWAEMAAAIQKDQAAQITDQDEVTDRRLQ